MARFNHCLALCACLLVGTTIEAKVEYGLSTGGRNCTVSLTEQISSGAHPCKDDKTYGCYDNNNSMWADTGCMGHFTCNGAPMECESRLSLGPRFAVCECTPGWAPGPAPPRPPQPPRPTPAPPAPVPKCTRKGAAVDCPNIVFLIDESTDGRTYREGFAPVSIPNVRKLAAKGVQFDTHYVNAPVCCPSRSSLWAGRYGYIYITPIVWLFTQRKGNMGVHGAYTGMCAAPCYPFFTLSLCCSNRSSVWACRHHPMASVPSLYRTYGLSASPVLQVVISTAVSEWQGLYQVAKGQRLPGDTVPIQLLKAVSA